MQGRAAWRGMRPGVPDRCLDPPQKLWAGGPIDNKLRTGTKGQTRGEEVRGRNLKRGRQRQELEDRNQGTGIPEQEPIDNSLRTGTKGQELEDRNQGIGIPGQEPMDRKVGTGSSGEEVSPLSHAFFLPHTTCPSLSHTHTLPLSLTHTHFLSHTHPSSSCAPAEEPPRQAGMGLPGRAVPPGSGERR